MSASGTKPIRRVVAWPRDKARNPYTSVLYEALGTTSAADGAPIEIIEFRVADAWRHKADIVHVHWPEACVESRSVVRALLKSVVVIFDLCVMRARGATIVWTCHNITSHEGRHPRIERVLRWCFVRLLGGVLHASPDAPAAAEAISPALADIAHEVVRHHSYTESVRLLDRTAARERFELGDEVVLVSVGSIRPYKNVSGLVRAFLELPGDLSPPVRLLVAGSVDDEALGEEIVDLGASSDAVDITLGWIDDDDLTNYLAAADAVVLPYTRLDNSGAAILALASGRPVAITRSASIDDLHSIVGDDWLLRLEDQLSPAVLETVIEWAALPRDGLPDLHALSPETIARETLAAYRTFHND